DPSKKVTPQMLPVKISGHTKRLRSIGYVSDEAPAKTLEPRYVRDDGAPVIIESEAARQAKAVLTVIHELADRIADCRADDVAQHLSDAERGNFIDAIDEVGEFIAAMRRALGARPAKPTHDIEADPNSTKH